MRWVTSYIAIELQAGYSWFVTLGLYMTVIIIMLLCIFDAYIGITI